MDNPNFDDKDFSKVLDKLTKKSHEASSSDGLVTLLYSGLGDYKKLTINLSLDQIDKAVLERDILDVFAYAKNQLSLDINNILLNNNNDSSTDIEEEDNKNVS